MLSLLIDRKSKISLFTTTVFTFKIKLLCKGNVKISAILKKQRIPRHCILWWNKWCIIIMSVHPRAGPSLQAQEPRLQFCRRQVFHHKLRNQGCSFTRDWIGAVASHCFLHPTLSLASEQTLKDLKISGAPTWRWGEWISPTGPSGLHRNSPQELNIRVFDQIRDLEIPITLRPQNCA